MKKLISILGLIVLTGCTTIVEKDTYLKYSGYMEGCVDGLTVGVLAARQDLMYEDLNQVWVDTHCMDMYLRKLERDDIEPPEGIDTYLDRNEMI